MNTPKQRSIFWPVLAAILCSALIIALVVGSIVAYADIYAAQAKLKRLKAANEERQQQLDMLRQSNIAPAPTP